MKKLEIINKRIYVIQPLKDLIEQPNTEEIEINLSRPKEAFFFGFVGCAFGTLVVLFIYLLFN